MASEGGGREGGDVVDGSEGGGGIGGEGGSGDGGGDCDHGVEGGGISLGLLPFKISNSVLLVLDASFLIYIYRHQRQRTHLPHTTVV